MKQHTSLPNPMSSASPLIGEGPTENCARHAPVPGAVQDVKSLAVPTMAHRISMKPEMWVRRVHGADVVEELLRRLPVPRAQA